jgi:hypothetical protein
MAEIVHISIAVVSINREGGSRWIHDTDDQAAEGETASMVAGFRALQTRI